MTELMTELMTAASQNISISEYQQHIINIAACVVGILGSSFRTTGAMKEGWWSMQCPLGDCRMEKGKQKTHVVYSLKEKHDGCDAVDEAQLCIYISISFFLSLPA